MARYQVTLDIVELYSHTLYHNERLTSPYESQMIREIMPGATFQNGCYLMKAIYNPHQGNNGVFS